MRFEATINQAGKTATGIVVPDDVVQALDAGKKPPVRVTINDHTYRSTIASRGDRFLLGISADVREKAGVAAGDVIDVELTLDTEPRTVEVPPELAKALSSAARKRFDALSYSAKHRLVRPIATAKTDTTRERNVAKAVAELRQG